MKYEPSEASAGRHLNRRDWAERLLSMADHLAPSDAELVRAVYGRGLTVTALARAARRPQRGVRTRLQRLVERIASPTFQVVLTQHLRWPRERQEVARAVFLRGESQRQAAARLGVTIHRIRRESDRIRALIEATCETASVP